MSDESEKPHSSSSKKRQIVLLVLAFFMGAFWLFALRFILLDTQETHYHANFGIYINGSRIPFDNFTYYEEVQSCFGGDSQRPQDRVHMHDMVQHIVHVHDEAVTWGHFFSNIGITVSDRVLAYDKVIYLDDEETRIQFYLNGEEVDSISNRVIGNEDALLISAGKSSEIDLETQYAEITKDAAEYNQRTDPSACSGGKELSLIERAKAALGFTNE